MLLAYKIVLCFIIEAEENALFHKFQYQRYSWQLAEVGKPVMMRKP